MNPWTKIPDANPYVLESDGRSIEKFNRRATARTLIHLDLLPEPFLGNPDAPVVLLNLNPGYSDQDILAHTEPGFMKRCRENLIHAASEYPFYLLDPGLKSPGGAWWNQRLGPVMNATSREAVAQRVLCVEYFGYHSAGYAHDQLMLPSMSYGFELVRKAISRDAVIVVMRSANRWVAAVPELDGYEKRFHLRSVQNVTISPRNCPDGFDEIVAAIERPLSGAGGIMSGEQS